MARRFAVRDTGPWAAVERARLRRLCRTVQKSAIEINVATDEFDRALAEAEALRITDPYCERLTALMVTALHDSGRQAEALTAYLDAKRRLVADLGLEPSAALAALHPRWPHCTSASRPTMSRSGAAPPDQPCATTSLS